MTKPTGYFEAARSWATDVQLREAHGRRTAWLVAGFAMAVALFEAVVLALMMPLKTERLVTVLVDRQTGYVQALDPLQPRRIGADAALTQSFLAQYVTAREGFDRATIANDYRHVALWSWGPARARYLALMPAGNPDSPLRRVPGGGILSARVKSVSPLSPGTALVRFDTARQDRGGATGPWQPWVAVVRYRYSDAPMSLEDRLVNPLGFQVTGYRRDAEAPPPPASDGPPAVAQADVRVDGDRANVEIRSVPRARLPLGSPLGRYALGGLPPARDMP